MVKDEMINYISKIKGKALYLLIFLINLILIFFIVDSFNEFSPLLRNFKFERLREHCLALFVSYLDRNGREEIVSIYPIEPFPPTYILGAFSPFFPSAIIKFNFFAEILVSPSDMLLQPLDLDQDGKIEIPVLETQKNEIILKLLDAQCNLKKTIRFTNPLMEGQFLINIIFEDIDGDGSKEMIGLVDSGFSALPRGVVVFNVSSAKLLWGYYMGCMPNSAKTIDFDKDGRKEIVISGWSPHNGVVANGTDDDHSYIILVDHEGKKIWQQILGGYYTMLSFEVTDIDQDGELEIITSKSCHREIKPEPGEIRILDARTGDTERYIYETGVSFSDMHFINKEGNNPSLVIGDSEGRVSILDKNLNKVKSINLEYPARIRGVGGLGRNAKENNIFVQSGFTNFYILDSNLRKLHKFTFKDFNEIEKLSFLSISNQNEKAGILNADNLYLIKKEPLRVSSLIISFLKSRLASYLLAFVFFNFLMIYLVQKRKFVRPDLSGIKEDWLEMAQEIAHKMKNPMFTIQLEAERLNLLIKKNENQTLSQDLTASTESILDDVKSLNELIRAFLKLLIPKPLKLKNTELNSVVQRVVQRYAELLKGKIEFVLDLDRESTVISVDEEQIEEAIMNIILNSIDALPDGGKIKISTTVIYSPIVKAKKGIQMEIEDTGIGIPKDKIGEIFKPYYTTKKEGIGIGLTITKRIIELHGGKIDVYSKPGVGTKFAIFLPWKS